MYRIVLITATASRESQMNALLGERMRGRYLMKVSSGPLSDLPAVNGQTADVVLLDLDAPDIPEQLRQVLEIANPVPVIGLRDESDEAVELAVIKNGAQDCLIIPELTARGLARTIRNAVERSHVEQRLAREQEMLGSLLAQLPDRIYFKDLQSRFVRISKAMANIFHLNDPGLAIGKSDHDFFTVEHARPALEDEQTIIRTGLAILDKLEKETLPDGTVGWVLTSKLPLRNSLGEIVGTFGISHDVTAMKLLEDAVECERNRLRELSEELAAKNLQLEQDLVMAKGIQEAMLPGRRAYFPENAAPGSPGIRFSSVYRPAAAIGGDFFTIIPVSDTRVGVLICDIMGHGLRAALGTAIVRGLVEEMKGKADQPAEFLTSLNLGLRAILRNIDEPLLVTACYLVADRETGEVLVSSAGHPRPLLAHRITGSVEPMELHRAARGPALALFDDAVYGVERCSLAEDALVLLFTDGAIEMSDLQGREIGIDSFIASAKRHVGDSTVTLCERVLDDIQQAAAGADFIDDVCIVAIERCCPSGSQLR